jgi:DNA-nicking Smr family endonuclease
MATARDNDREREPTNRRGLSNEDAQLWRRAIADVRPLREAKQQAPNPGATPPATPPANAGIPAGSARQPVAARPLASPIELEAGKATGIDKRTVARLRRGLIVPETQIDLHQQTQEQAHRLLDRFLDASQASGRRCVLVITGKGRRSGGAGVLRMMVPRWLNEQPNRRRVLAFCYAVPAHGGDGALYVLLRKSRPPTSRLTSASVPAR